MYFGDVITWVLVFWFCWHLYIVYNGTKWAEREVHLLQTKVNLHSFGSMFVVLLLNLLAFSEDTMVSVSDEDDEDDSHGINQQPSLVEQ